MSNSFYASSIVLDCHIPVATLVHDAAYLFVKNRSFEFTVAHAYFPCWTRL